MNIIHNQNTTVYGTRLNSVITYVLERMAGQAAFGGGYARVVKRL
jgi:hypothetical protein